LEFIRKTMPRAAAQTTPSERIRTVACRHGFAVRSVPGAPVYFAGMVNDSSEMMEYFSKSLIKFAELFFNKKMYDISKYL
jgi:hypothetical protein